MIKLNSTIIYGLQVCKVTGIKDMTIGKATRQYYVLSPIYDDKNTIYAPTDNPKVLKKIKEILSAEEIAELIRNMPENEPLWVEDDKERAQLYRDVFERGDRTEIIRMLKTLFEKQKELAEKGRKLRSADEIAFQRAEKMIYDEFALVLDIKREEVVPFILENINKK